MNGTEARGYTKNDVGNARRLVDAHGLDLAHTSQIGWLAYEDGRYRADTTKEVLRRAVRVLDDTIKATAEEEDLAVKKEVTMHALRSQNAPRLRGMIEIAAAAPGIARSHDAFDRDPFLFNVANGTLDLRTGDLLPHDRAHLLTKLAKVAYDPGALAPRFEAFVADIMAGDLDMVAYLQRAVGYSLTGRTIEQVLFLLCGTGRNGKGALMRTLQAATGDYHRKADIDSFLETKVHRIKEDIADLMGARVVTAEEPTKGRQLSEARLKEITGGDDLSARFLRRDRFTFRPLFKLWLACNDRPVVSGTDFGIWSRIHLIEFPRTFTKDVTLEPHMQGPELPGVLAWMVRGCLAWQKQGLAPPEKVQASTQAYREEQDVFGAFLLDCCHVDNPSVQENASALFERYQRWASDQRERPMSQTGFGRELTSRGFKPDRTRNGIRRTGIVLRLAQNTPSPPSPDDAGAQCEELGPPSVIALDARADTTLTEKAFTLFTTIHSESNGNGARTPVEPPSRAHLVDDYELDERLGQMEDAP